MKYSWEFKYQCVLDYKEGKRISKEPFGNNQNKLYRVRVWVRLFDIYGVDGLKHKQVNKEWTAEERFELVAKVFAGQPKQAVAIESGINIGQ